MSEFYLDTVLQDDDLKRIGHVLRESGYSIIELKEINAEEVGPVLLPNLFSVAGVWAGFDENWLVNEIKKNMSRKRWSPFRSLQSRSIERHTRQFWDRLETFGVTEDG